MKNSFSNLSVLMSALFFFNTLGAQKAVISVPVADLRIKPIEVTEFQGRDMDQETQLLYGEHIEILEEQGNWVKVKALEQPDYYGNNKEWGFEQGWLKKGTYIVVDEFPMENVVVKKTIASVNDRKYQFLCHLSLGTKLVAETDKDFKHKGRVQLYDGKEGFIYFSDLEELVILKNNSAQETREKIVWAATQFLGMPYRWGGRSNYNEFNPHQRTSVDCSGLSDLCYRVAGLTIPRNSKDQYIGSSPLDSGSQLQKGDLIFTARENNPAKISHVMIYAGDDSFIDASETDKKVRRTTGSKFWGKPLQEIQSGEELTASTGNNYFIFFGTYFNND